MFIRLLREAVLLALNSVAVNKLRTFLSLFGITRNLLYYLRIYSF